MKVTIPKEHSLHDPITILDGWNYIPAFEIPLRVDSIRNALKVNDFEFNDPVDSSKRTITAIKKVHSQGYFNFLSYVYDKWSETQEHDKGVIPYCFTSKNTYAKDLGIINEVAQYSYDICTPILKHTFQAALNSVESALTATDLLLSGEKIVYALCRPPGHHAGKDYYGGFCYFNNAAICAKHIINSSPMKKIAILDLDYHHGNGTQDIFYGSNEVLYVSIHADPMFDYPFSWGTKNEIGIKNGKGYNINLPLALGSNENTYLNALKYAVAKVREFSPDTLIISLGVDTHKDDPLGSFKLDVDSYSRIGEALSKFKVPVLIIQEGGYDLYSMGECVRNFLRSIK